MVIPPTYKGGVFLQAHEKRRHKVCCVPYCDSKYTSSSYHKFPNKIYLRNLWKINCGLDKDIPNHSLVCGKHFLTSDYVLGKAKGDSRKPMLLKNAVPSQYLPTHKLVRHNIENDVTKMKKMKRLLKRKLIEPESDTRNASCLEIKMENCSETYMWIKSETEMEEPTDREIFTRVKCEPELGVHSMDETFSCPQIKQKLDIETTSSLHLGIPKLETIGDRRFETYSLPPMNLTERQTGKKETKTKKSKSNFVTSDNFTKNIPLPIEYVNVRGIPKNSLSSLDCFTEKSHTYKKWVRKCIVPSCNNAGLAGNFSLYKFPNKEENIMIWKKELNVLNVKIGKGSRVCGFHFHPTNFFPTNTSKRVLKKNAVPTLRTDTTSIK